MFGIQGLVIARRIETALGTYLHRNAFVTNFVPDTTGQQTEMTPVKAAFLSFAMIAAIAFCGIGIYSADASSGHAAVDGYGVTAALIR